MSWKGESRRHSLAKKGVKTASGSWQQERLHHEEQAKMIQAMQEVEDNYYEYLYNMMQLPYTKRILDSELTINQAFSMKEKGRTIELWDIHFYENNKQLKKLTYDEYIEMTNLMASEPRTTRDIHMKLAKKGWVSLYDGYYDAVVPSYRAYNQLKWDELKDHILEHEKRW